MHYLTGNIKAFTTGKPAFWIGALLSTGVGLLFYVATANTIENDAQNRFDSMARSVQTTINGRIKSYTDVLRGSASLFQISPNLTREQFSRYVDGLSIEKEFPGIEAINFARYVTEAERPEFESRMRKEIAAISSGYPPFRITPPGRRTGYNVIIYIEPIAGWINRIGFDITGFSRDGETPPHRVMRETGQIAASATPVPFLSGVNQTGLSIRIPIYRMSMRATTVEERRAAFVGSVGIGFRVQKLVEGVLDQMPVRGVRLTLTDIGPRPGSSQGVAAAPARVLYDSKATVAIPAPPMARPDRATFVTMLPMGYNMRVWEGHFSIRKSDLYTGFDAYVPWLAMLAGFVSTMLLYSLFQTLTSSRRNAVALAQNMTKELRASEAKLQRSNETLRRLGAHAEKIKEDERKRIAREIHDDLGQNLLALRIEADMLSSRTGERHPRLHTRARATVNQIDATIKSVRQIINDLRPNVLDLGLNAAVDWQIAEFRRRTGIECNLVENHQDIQINDHCATALFRILQESLSNISRHAQATRVQVVLRVERDWIWMSVADNGVGLPPKGRHKTGSFGLVGIEERIIILGGAFDIHSDPGAGTTIRVAVPMRDALQVPVPLSGLVDAFDHGTALV
ncbi:MAG: histidine kinase [Streptosporangiaceae bacterium]|nr:histidine kinase [Streptosporangiaceae bacterium]